MICMQLVLNWSMYLRWFSMVLSGKACLFRVSQFSGQRYPTKFAAFLGHLLYLGSKCSVSSTAGSCIRCVEHKRGYRFKNHNTTLQNYIGCLWKWGIPMHPQMTVLIRTLIHQWIWNTRAPPTNGGERSNSPICKLRWAAVATHLGWYQFNRRYGSVWDKTVATLRCQTPWSQNGVHRYTLHQILGNFHAFVGDLDAEQGSSPRVVVIPLGAKRNTIGSGVPIDLLGKKSFFFQDGWWAQCIFKIKLVGLVQGWSQRFSVPLADLEATSLGMMPPSQPRAMAPQPTLHGGFARAETCRANWPNQHGHPALDVQRTPHMKLHCILHVPNRYKNIHDIDNTHGTKP